MSKISESRLKYLGEKIKKLLYPRVCPFCERAIDKNEYACKYCIQDFPETPIKKQIAGKYECVSAFLYKDGYSRAVKRFKFSGIAVYSNQLAVPLSKSVKLTFGNVSFDLVTYVPMYKKDEKKRGFNQAELLAKDCSAILELPCFCTLEQYKPKIDQHSLGKNERAKNIKGIYRVSSLETIKGKNILIIDDILTTGSTLGECALTLKRGGCQSVYCATLCAVRKE